MLRTYVPSPGAPLLNDRGFRVIFLGLKFLPKVIFWVYERSWDFFLGGGGVAKKQRDFLGYAKKR